MRDRLLLALLPVVLAGAAACSGDGSTMREGPFRMLALGDSYTIGESVPEADRWPVQLAAMLSGEGIDVEVEIVARTGWTTAELDAGIDAAAPSGPYDLVTLLIGVNNQYRGLDLEEYRTEFAALLDRAAGFAGGDPARVIVVSIPDWGVTPFAAARGERFVGGVIDAFNDVNREGAAGAGAAWVDVTSVSRSGDPGLVAGDGLHPSGEQYRRWAEAILPEARAILGG